MYMHMALLLTSADKIPAEAVSEVMEHTVAMLLESRKEKSPFRCYIHSHVST